MSTENNDNTNTVATDRGPEPPAKKTKTEPTEKVAPPAKKTKTKPTEKTAVAHNSLCVPTQPLQRHRAEPPHFTL
eukprot:COSAG06_NODE_1423_length_9499_cov_65.511967_3_plen_75_part_00